MNRPVLSEIEAQASRLEALAYAPSSRILRDGLLPLQSSRAGAYGRLNAALRAFLSGECAPEDYPIVCANCAEDLKLAGEGVVYLERVCRRRSGKEFDGIADACVRLQALEERKMVAIVSVHAIKRSRKVGGKDGLLDAFDKVEDGVVKETLDVKIVRFSKQLAEIDAEIGEIVEDWRDAGLD